MKKEIKIEETSFKSPFQVDDDFLSQLEKKISEQIDETAALPVIGNPMVVPKGYFNDLEKAILSKTIVEEKQSPFKSIFKNTKWLYGAAASVVVAIGLYLYSFQQQATYPSINDLSEAEITAYLDSEPIPYGEIASSIPVNEELANSLWQETLNVSPDELENIFTDLEMEDTYSKTI